MLYTELLAHGGEGSDCTFDLRLNRADALLPELLPRSMIFTFAWDLHPDLAVRSRPFSC